MAQKTNADLLALWEGLTDAPKAADTDATLDTVVQQLNADFEACPGLTFLVRFVLSWSSLQHR